jgi:hypothetical protein
VTERSAQLKAVVRAGRLVLDEPTQLPEGTELRLRTAPEPGPTSEDVRPAAIQRPLLLEGPLVFAFLVLGTAAVITALDPPWPLDAFATVWSWQLLSTLWWVLHQEDTKASVSPVWMAGAMVLGALLIALGAFASDSFGSPVPTRWVRLYLYLALAISVAVPYLAVRFLNDRDGTGGTFR